MHPFWSLLRLELELWRRAGYGPVLWWRDDDARHASPELRGLLELAAHHAVPLTLAVVPAGSLDGLARLLEGFPAARVAQHGVTHANARAPGEPADEFAAAEQPEGMAIAIATGRAGLGGLPGLLPLYVPPWNRLTPALAAALELAGQQRVSGHAGEGVVPPGMQRLDAHLDLLRWRGGPRFRGEIRFLARCLRLLRQRRRDGAWEAPIGLLTHHLDHDEAAWRFLNRFLAETMAARGLRWACAGTLLAVAGPEDGPAAPRPSLAATL